MNIDEKLSGVTDRISARIFFGKNYNYTPSKLWSVTLEYSFEGVKTEVAEHASTLEEAFAAAWTKTERLLTRGLGPAIMRPALEAPKVDG